MLCGRIVLQVGFVVEVSEERVGEVVEAYKASGVEAVNIGRVTDDGKVRYETIDAAAAAVTAAAATVAAAAVPRLDDVT